MADAAPAAAPATSALGTAGATDSYEPVMTAAQMPLAQRLKCGAIAFALQKLLIAPLSFAQRIHEYLTPSAEGRPTLVKTYPARKSLHVRIFFPKSHTATSTKRLPTLLTIHGGGFVVGTPRDNDSWNAEFANRHNFLVVALNYAKAPGSPFPAPIYDLEALIGAVLSDDTLPIDASRVALAGWSAGGNLALAVSQLEGVRTRVRAVVPLYPIVDYVPPIVVKSRTRRYKPALGGFRAREADYLLAISDVFNWAYVAAGQACDHPLLSPFYAEPGALPSNIFVIACEMDLLGQEAWRFACKIAGRDVPAVTEAMGREEVVGKGELILQGDERFAFEERAEDGSHHYRWLLVPDTIHGFDQNIGGMVRDAALMDDARIKTDKVIGLIGEWLLSGPLESRPSRR